jgi:hypothetical protein
MKKIIMVSMIALIAAFGFVGCGSEDNTKADLKWQNKAGIGNFVENIKWSNGGKVDQSWDGVVDNDAETSFKGISELAGQGDCLDNTGAPATIELNPTGSTGYTGTISLGDTSATIEENASAILVIDNAQAK